MIKPYIRSVRYLLVTWNFVEYIWDDSRIIIHSGDIETNPGPKHSFSSQSLKICHWNLSSLSSAYHVQKSYFIVGLQFCSQIRYYLFTNLDIKTLPDDDDLEIPGYNIIRRSPI